MKLWKKDLPVHIFKFREGIFNIHRRMKDMADFHNLQGKFEPLTLKSENIIKMHMKTCKEDYTDESGPKAWFPTTICAHNNDTFFAENRAISAKDECSRLKLLCLGHHSLGREALWKSCLTEICDLLILASQTHTFLAFDTQKECRTFVPMTLLLLPPLLRFVIESMFHARKYLFSVCKVLEGV